MSDYKGYVVIDGTATSFIATASGTADQSIALAQYLNANGSPSAEFVQAPFGFCAYSTPLLNSTGSHPHTITASHILTLPIAANGTTNTGPNAPLALPTWRLLRPGQGSTRRWPIGSAAS